MLRWRIIIAGALRNPHSAVDEEDEHNQLFGMEKIQERLMRRKHIKMEITNFRSRRAFFFPISKCNYFKIFKKSSMTTKRQRDDFHLVLRSGRHRDSLMR